jgi:hypothetical protein
LRHRDLLQNLLGVRKNSFLFRMLKNAQIRGTRNPEE